MPPARDGASEPVAVDSASWGIPASQPVCAQDTAFLRKATELASRGCEFVSLTRDALQLLSTASATSAQLMQAHSAVLSGGSTCLALADEARSMSAGAPEIALRGWPTWSEAAQGAEDLAARLASAIAEKAAHSVREATLRLEPGGRPDGGSWKSASTIYFQDVCRDLEKCFWGANATVIGSLETGVQHLQAKMDEYAELCGRLGSQPDEEVMTPAREKSRGGSSR